MEGGGAEGVSELEAGAWSGLGRERSEFLLTISLHLNRESNLQKTVYIIIYGIDLSTYRNACPFLQLMRYTIVSHTYEVGESCSAAIDLCRSTRC